jgi:hypothetical protein
MTLSPSQPPHVAANRFGRFAVSVEDHDCMRKWTWLAIGGLATAALFALIGGFPLEMPMPMMAFGWVSPTCGLTRGSTAIARGDFSLAWQYNPAAFLVVGFGVTGVLRVLVGAATGRWLLVSARPQRAGLLILAAMFLALWANQQSNAEFIITSRV